MTRKNYEDSYIRLQQEYLEEGEIPPIPNEKPKFDDEVIGVNFYKTFIGDGDDLSNLTLPRTFIGRCEINDVNFQNNNFSESNFSWNDFINVYFSQSILEKVDFRDLNFDMIKFNGSDLSGADFRHCSFENCDFTSAKMDQVKLNVKYKKIIKLSADQINKIEWSSDDGAEPDGG